MNIGTYCTCAIVGVQLHRHTLQSQENRGQYFVGIKKGHFQECIHASYNTMDDMILGYNRQVFIVVAYKSVPEFFLCELKHPINIGTL